MKNAARLLCRMGVAASAAVIPAASAPAAPQLALAATTPELLWRWRAAPPIARQPRLLARLRAEARGDLAEARSEWGDLARQRRDQGEATIRSEVRIGWQVVADTPRLLALSRREEYIYAGAPHPWQTVRTLLWDKTSQRIIPAGALFSDWALARAPVAAAYCQAFIKARIAAADGNAAAVGSNCSLDDDRLLPSGTRRADRFIVFDLYPDGYVSGEFATELRWPPATRARVRPAYRADLLGNQR